jgi:hypothetical protein
MLINHLHDLEQAQINKKRSVNKPTSTVAWHRDASLYLFSYYLECRNLIKTLIQYLE